MVSSAGRGPSPRIRSFAHERARYGSSAIRIGTDHGCELRQMRFRWPRARAGVLCPGAPSLVSEEERETGGTHKSLK
jgi:hypothetical protein